MANIILDAGVRNNLLSLQSIGNQMQTTQERLATGKKVNSPIDNPVSYFRAETLYSRANDLSGLLDNMGQAKATIDAASNGVATINKLIQSAQGLAQAALATNDTAARASYAAQFDVLASQIAGVALDSGYQGTNLLGGDSLDVNFNESGTTSLTVSGIAAPVISAAAGSWASDANIDTAVTNLASATATLKTFSVNLGSNSSVIQNRISFTNALVNTLNGGADSLVKADDNAESANMLALQTRQQLAVAALSLATQSAQSVLRLF